MKDVTEFECESCSNEPKDKINLARFFAKLDEIFFKRRPCGGRQTY